MLGMVQLEKHKPGFVKGWARVELVLGSPPALPQRREQHGARPLLLGDTGLLRAHVRQIL